MVVNDALATFVYHELSIYGNARPPDLSDICDILLRWLWQANSAAERASSGIFVADTAGAMTGHRRPSTTGNFASAPRSTVASAKRKRRSPSSVVHPAGCSALGVVSDGTVCLVPLLPKSEGKEESPSPSDLLKLPWRACFAKQCWRAICAEGKAKRTSMKDASAVLVAASQSMKNGDAPKKGDAQPEKGLLAGVNGVFGVAAPSIDFGVTAARIFGEAETICWAIGARLRNLRVTAIVEKRAGRPL